MERFTWSRSLSSQLLRSNFQVKFKSTMTVVYPAPLRRGAHEVSSMEKTSLWEKSQIVLLSGNCKRKMTIVWGGVRGMWPMTCAWEVLPNDRCDWLSFGLLKGILFLFVIALFREDPRLHACIVCASISCPNVRREAYTVDKIDQQMTDQMTSFLANPKKGTMLSCVCYPLMPSYVQE